MSINRIRQLRLEKGLSQDALAELVGTTGPTIQRLESGKRQLTQTWATRISEHLGVEVAEIFGNILPVAEPGLPVLGEVQAGVWREAETADDERHPSIPLAPDPRFPSDKQFALLVRGESMNLVFPPGQFIICVSWTEIQRQPRDGDLVVVERRRHGLVEATVKRVRYQQNKLFLMPESSDPKWRDPIELGLDGSTENDEIIVTALVIGRYELLA